MGVLCVVCCLVAGMDLKAPQSPAATGRVIYAVIITLIEGFLVEKPLYQPEGRAKFT